MARAGTVYVDVRADTSGFAADLQRQATNAARSLGSIASSGAKALFDDLGTAAGVAAVAVGGIGAAAVNASMDFNKAVSGVAAVAGATAGELNALREAALKAGADTSFSASEAAKAEAELAKAGVSVADILGGALSGSLGLAAAGQIGLADAATISAQALNIFKLSGDQTTRVADVLAAGANKSAADVGQLGQALQQGGLVAAQLGLSLEDTIGALSLFADNALQGSDAGTSFKTMLSRFTPNSYNAGTFKELGLTFFDLNGQFVGLEEAAARLQRAMSGLSQEQRQSALNAIFGSDAVRAASILYSAGAEGIREYTTAVSDQGAAARMAAMQLDNLAGDVEAFKGSVETALIRIGDLADPTFRALTQGATGVVNAFNDFADTPAFSRIQANLDRIGGQLSEALGGIADGVARFLDGISAADVDRFFQSVEGGFGRLREGAEGLEGVFAGLGVALGTGLAAQIPIIGGLLPVISPLTGVLVGLVAGSEDARDAVAGLAGKFGELVDRIGPDFLDGLASVAQELGSGLGAALTSIGDAAIDAADVLGPVLADGLREVAGPLGDVVAAAGELIAALVDNLAPAIASAVGPALSVVADVLGVIAPALSLAADNAELLLPALGALVAVKFADTFAGWAGVVGEFASKLGAIPGAIDQIAATQGVSRLEALRGVVGSTATEAKNAAATFVDGLSPATLALTGAVAVGAIAWKSYADEQARVGKASQELVDNLKVTAGEFDRQQEARSRAVFTEQGALEVANQSGRSLAELSDLATRYGDSLSNLKGRWSESVNEGRSFRDLVADLPRPVRDLANDIDRLFQSGAIGNQQALDFFTALGTLADSTAEGIRNAKAEFSSIAQEAAAAGQITGAQLDDILAKIAAAKTPEDLRKVFEELNGILTSTGDAASGAAEKIQRLIDKLAELTNADRDADEASRRLAESVARTADSFARGKGIDENTEAGLRNAEAIAQQVEAAEKLAAALALLDPTGQRATQVLQDQANALAFLRDTGQITADEYQRLIALYDLTPEAIQTTVSADVAAAQQSVRDITDQLNKIPGGPQTDPIKAQVTALLNQGQYDAARAKLAELERVYRAQVDVVVRTQIANNGSGVPFSIPAIENATGRDINGNGIIGRRFGGPVRQGQPYIVGEQGPELLVPSANGVVIPNGRTEQLLQPPPATSTSGLEAAILSLAGALASQAGGSSMPQSPGGITVNVGSVVAPEPGRVPEEIVRAAREARVLMS